MSPAAKSPGDQFHFIDGSGGGESVATTDAIVTLLQQMSQADVFPHYLDSVPVLGVNGSLALVTDFMSDPSLAGAQGNVRSKTGTFVTADESGALSIRAQALGGYIDTRGGRRLA